MGETRIDVRLPLTQKQILDDYCKATGRTRTDVIREFIRSQPQKIPRRIDKV